MHRHPRRLPECRERESETHPCGSRQRSPPSAFILQFRYNARLMPTRLIELVERLPSAEVLLVGDFMLDRYLYGNAERLSPEAPVPVLHFQREETRLGGAGGGAAELAAFGGGGRGGGGVGGEGAAKDVGEPNGGGG